MDELKRLNEALDRLEKSNKNSVIKGIVIALVPILITSIGSFIIAATVIKERVTKNEKDIKEISLDYVKEDDFIRVLKTVDYNFKVINHDNEQLLNIKDNYKSK